MYVVKEMKQSVGVLCTIWTLRLLGLLHQF